MQVLNYFVLVRSRNQHIVFHYKESTANDIKQHIIYIILVIFSSLCQWKDHKLPLWLCITSIMDFIPWQQNHNLKSPSIF